MRSKISAREESQKRYQSKNPCRQSGFRENVRSSVGLILIGPLLLQLLPQLARSPTHLHPLPVAANWRHLSPASTTSIFLLFLTWNLTLAKDPFLLRPHYLELSSTCFSHTHFYFNFSVSSKLTSFLLELSLKPDCLHGFLNWYRFWPFSLAEIFDLIDFDGLNELNCFCVEGCPWRYFTIVKWTIN